MAGEIAVENGTMEQGERGTGEYLFVTVGSTDFDPLVEAVDQLAASLPTDGIMQIGHGNYEPVNMPYVRFAPSLEPYYEQASLVIAHGGLATTMEVLRRGTPLISLSNPDRYDDHQTDLLKAMDDEGYLVWCRQLKELAEAIERARTVALKPYEQPHCEINKYIHAFLDRSWDGRRDTAPPFEG
jgi:UDP-N-acetylglucosamine transferase subunit ALG13